MFQKFKPRDFHAQTIQSETMFIPPCWDTISKIQSVNHEFNIALFKQTAKNFYDTLDISLLLGLFDKSISMLNCHSSKISDGDIPYKSHQVFLQELQNKYSEIKTYSSNKLNKSSIKSSLWKDLIQ